MPRNNIKGQIGPIGDDLPSLLPAFFGVVIFIGALSYVSLSDTSLMKATEYTISMKRAAMEFWMAYDIEGKMSISEPAKSGEMDAAQKKFFERVYIGSKYGFNTMVKLKCFKENAEVGCPITKNNIPKPGVGCLAEIAEGAGLCDVEKFCTTGSDDNTCDEKKFQERYSLRFPIGIEYQDVVYPGVAEVWIYK